MSSSGEQSDSDSSSSSATSTTSSSDSSSSSGSDSNSSESEHEMSKTQDVPPSQKSEKQKLLLDDSSDDEEESSDEEGGDVSANAPTSILKVNKKYAREFDQRKRREELLNARQAGEKLGSDGDEDDSSSEEEDEDGELMTPGMDLSILRTLKALKNRDDSIYDKNAKFFPGGDDDDGSDDDGEGNKKKSKSHKPMKYKDVVREQVLEQMDAEERGEGGKGGDSDDEDGNAASRRRQDEDGPASRFAYDDEQRELRAAFLSSTMDNSDDGDDDDKSDGDDDGDNWMVKKSLSKADADRAQKLVESEISALEKLGTGDATVSDPRGEVGDGDKFLLDFIKNKRWVDPDLQGSDDDSDGDGNEERGIYRSKMNNDDDEGDGHDSDASLDELEQMDAFESKYNFRFEEAAASSKSGESGAAYSVVGYARGGAHTTDTLRRKDETRKQKRLARKEKKAAERKAKEERLRRLKNAKREELEGRMKQVRHVAGAAEEGDANIDEAAIMKLMEGDFDPDKFEAMMSKAYGDDFYDKEDAEWKTDADVKESIMRDETGAEGDIVNEDTRDMYDEYNDEEAGGDDELGDGGGEDGGDEDLDFDPEPPVDFEEETGIEKKLREKMEDELYKLDYEDIIGDMPTRFKYRKVEANRFGLTPQEILFAKDTTLKQFVSLKRMAPYTEGEEYFPGTKKRKRFRDLAKHDYEELKEAEPEAGVEETQDPAATEETDDVDKPKKKRRRQKKKKKGADTAGTDEPAKEKKDAAKENASEEKAEKKNKKKKEKQVSTDSPAATSDARADAKKKRRQKKNKDGKSGSKKKKASKIAGVAASRLAAYGL